MNYNPNPPSSEGAVLPGEPIERMEADAAVKEKREQDAKEEEEESSEEEEDEEEKARKKKEKLAEEYDPCNYLELS